MTAAGAATAAGDVGIVDGETFAHRAVEVVDRGAVQVQGDFFPRDDGNAMLFITGVDCRIEFGVEPQGVLQARAAAAGHAHPQMRVAFELLRFDMPLDFSRRGFGKNNRHNENYLQVEGEGLVFLV